MIIRLVSTFGLSALILALVFVLGSGTLLRVEGWIYLAMLYLPMVGALVYFLRKDPDLLRRRMMYRESRPRQTLLIRITGPLFIAGFVIPGLDHRFGWSALPFWLVLVGDAGVLAGYLLVLRVFAVNTWAGRTLRVVEGQQVIDKGPYGIVRHPMYLGATVLYLFSPIALGSWWAYLTFGLVPFVLAWRIGDEEAMLREELPGYEDYCRRVRWRLVPGIW